MDFTALDFETANHRRDSACQIGLAVVRGGKIVDRGCWLIRPEPLSFNTRNIQVHGIRPHQVQNQPSFGELWCTLRPYLEGECLIAHNAAFDMGVLQGCLESHRCAIPPLQFNCTRSIARAAWPGRPGYGLKPLSDWLGVRFQHHDALEDAVACAKILLAAAIAKNANSLSDLETALRLKRGTLSADGYQPAGRTSRVTRSRSVTKREPSIHGSLMGAGASIGEQTVSESPVAELLREASSDYQPQRIDYQRLYIRAGFIGSLRNQSVVCTGQFSSLTRDELERLIIRAGGEVAGSVSKHVQLVVIGTADPRTIESGRSLSIKEEVARELSANGHPIRLVNEQEFLQLVQTPAAEAMATQQALSPEATRSNSCLVSSMQSSASYPSS